MKPTTQYGFRTLRRDGRLMFMSLLTDMVAISGRL